jgi:hypothetical protein
VRLADRIPQASLFPAAKDANRWLAARAGDQTLALTAFGACVTAPHKPTAAAQQY